MNEEKTFFNPGDTVTIRQTISNAPTMIVKGLDKIVSTDGTTTKLLGVICFWFTESLQYQEFRFNTKDLVHAE